MTPTARNHATRMATAATLTTPAAQLALTGISAPGQKHATAVSAAVPQATRVLSQGTATATAPNHATRIATTVTLTTPTPTCVTMAVTAQLTIRVLTEYAKGLAEIAITGMFATGLKLATTTPVNREQSWNAMTKMIAQQILVTP